MDLDKKISLVNLEKKIFDFSKMAIEYFPYRLPCTTSNCKCLSARITCVQGSSSLNFFNRT